MNEFERNMKKVRKMEKVFSDYGTKTGIDTDLLKQYEYSNLEEDIKMKNNVYRGKVTPSEGVKKGDIWYMVQANKNEVIPHIYNGEIWEPKRPKGTVHVDSTPKSVDSPMHYNKGKYEVIDVIEDWGLNFNLGNAIKYIARCNHKGNKVKDLQKAIWYLQREITSKGE